MPKSNPPTTPQDSQGSSKKQKDDAGKPVAVAVAINTSDSPQSETAKLGEKRKADSLQQKSLPEGTKPAAAATAASSSGIRRIPKKSDRKPQAQLPSLSVSNKVAVAVKSAEKDEKKISPDGGQAAQEDDEVDKYLERQLQLKRQERDNFITQLHATCESYENSKSSYRHFCSFIAPSKQKDPAVLCGFLKVRADRNKERTTALIARMKDKLAKIHPAIKLEVAGTKRTKKIHYLLIMAKGSVEDIKQFSKWREENYLQWQKGSSYMTGEGAELLLEQFQGSHIKADAYAKNLFEKYNDGHLKTSHLHGQGLLYDEEHDVLASFVPSVHHARHVSDFSRDINVSEAKIEQSKPSYIKLIAEDNKELCIIIFTGEKAHKEKFWGFNQKAIPTVKPEGFLIKKFTEKSHINPQKAVKDILKILMDKFTQFHKVKGIKHEDYLFGRLHYIPELDAYACFISRQQDDQQERALKRMEQRLTAKFADKFQFSSPAGTYQTSESSPRFVLVYIQVAQIVKKEFSEWIEEIVNSENPEIKVPKEASSEEEKSLEIRNSLGMSHLLKLHKNNFNETKEFVGELEKYSTYIKWGIFVPFSKPNDSGEIVYYAIYKTSEKKFMANRFCKVTLAKKLEKEDKALSSFSRFNNFSTSKIGKDDLPHPIPIINFEQEQFWLLSYTVPADKRNVIDKLIAAARKDADKRAEKKQRKMNKMDPMEVDNEEKDSSPQDSKNDMEVVDDSFNVAKVEDQKLAEAEEKMNSTEAGHSAAEVLVQLLTSASEEPAKSPLTIPAAIENLAKAASPRHEPAPPVVIAKPISLAELPLAPTFLKQSSPKAQASVPVSEPSAPKEVEDLFALEGLSENDMDIEAPKPSSTLG